MPGARLGILASGDSGLIAAMKKDVAIWNINSFGEFFMQIYEKYEKAYRQSLRQLSDARRIFEENLRAIPGVKVLPSQANYITVELTGSKSSRAVTRRLYIERNFLVKDLTPKMRRPGRQYLRLSVRTDAENKALTDALQDILAAGAQE